MKDRSQISNKRNGLFAVKCMNCKFKMWIKTTNLDVGRTMKFQFNVRDSKILGHMKENNNHVIPMKVFDLKSFKNNADLQAAFELKRNDV